MKRFSLAIALALVLAAALPAGVLADASLFYNDVDLAGGFATGHFPEIWDLTACDMTITFELDLNGIVDDAGAHAWAEFGVRAVGYGDFNPTSMAEGAGVWLATDYDWTANTFDPDPDGAPALDMDDKLILQKGGGMGEGAYNLPSTPSPSTSGSNHRIWFDRDGVDQWQDDNPLAVNGGTYNTGGTYDIVLSLSATGDTSGTAYMTVNGLDQGFETDGNWNTMELTPAGMTFTGDMTQMQVFYGLYGYGATHAVHFRDITVTGCLYEIPITIDIKPGSDPNSINLTSNGVVPVAVLGSAGFDVQSIDARTLSLDGAEVGVRGKEGMLRCAYEDVNGDGFTDLMCQFYTNDLVWTSGSTEATLTGKLFNGQLIAGSDTINIVRE